VIFHGKQRFLIFLINSFLKNPVDRKN